MARRDPAERLPTAAVGCLPPACWPPGSPEGSRCRHGAMPGRQGRMSGTPPPRRPARRSHSSLTACPGPRLAGHGRWRVRDAPSARAASLASSAALLYAPGDAAYPARWRAGGPHVIPYVNPYVIPYALGVRTPVFAGRAHRCWSVPLRGASQPQKPRLTGPPRGKWSGQARKVRFARLIQRPVRVLGGPAARAACGGNLSPSWRPLGVVFADAIARADYLLGRSRPANHGWAGHHQGIAPKLLLCCAQPASHIVVPGPARGHGH